MPYIGSGPEIDNVSLKTFSGDASTVAFDLVTVPNSDNQVLAFVGGEIQHDWTRSTSTITFTTAPSTGTDNVNIYIMGKPVNIGTPSDDTVGQDQLVAGSVVQVVNVMDGEVNTGTTVFPYDDTIPQNTEGDEYLTLAITPKSTTNLLKIEVIMNLSHSTALSLISSALFQDSTANALAAVTTNITTAFDKDQNVLTHWMVAGTVSATTFKVRSGSSLAGTTTYNGANTARRHSGLSAYSITITEIKA